MSGKTFHEWTELNASLQKSFYWEIIDRSNKLKKVENLQIVIDQI